MNRIIVTHSTTENKELKFLIPYVTLNNNGDGFDFLCNGSYFELTKHSKMIPIDFNFNGIQISKEGADKINFIIFKKLHLLHLERRLYVRSDLFQG